MTWGVVFLAAFVIVALIVLALDLLKRAVPEWLRTSRAHAGWRKRMNTAVTKAPPPKPARKRYHAMMDPQIGS